MTLARAAPCFRYSEAKRQYKAAAVQEPLRCEHGGGCHEHTAVEWLLEDKGTVGGCTHKPQGKLGNKDDRQATKGISVFLLVGIKWLVRVPHQQRVPIRLGCGIE